MRKTTPYVAAAAIVIGMSGCGKSEKEVQDEIKNAPRIVELQKAGYKLFTEPFEYDGAPLAIVPEFSLGAAMTSCSEKKLASKVEVIHINHGISDFDAVKCEPVDLVRK